jgi:hypothetical protein
MTTVSPHCCDACGRGTVSVRARQFLALVTAKAKK